MEAGRHNSEQVFVWQLPHNYLAAITRRLSYKTGHILCLRKSEDIMHILKQNEFIDTFIQIWHKASLDEGDSS